MSEQTPGPWAATPHGDGWHIVAHTPRPMKGGAMFYSRIATAHGMKGDDAKLLAAAPDLADALRAIVTFVATAKIRPEVQMMVSNLATNALLKAGCSPAAKGEAK